MKIYFKLRAEISKLREERLMREEIGERILTDMSEPSRK